MKKLIIILFIFISGCAGTLKDFGYESNPRPWTTEEKIYAGASILATFADYKTTVDLLDRGGYESINIITGKHPSDARLAITLGITEVIFLWLVHKFPRVRKLGLGAKTTVNTGLAIHNSGE